MNSNHRIALHNDRSFNSNVGPRVVYVQYECLKVGEIDTLNEKYYAEYLFIISWNENKFISTYDKNKEWNPMVYIDNYIGNHEIMIEYETFHNNNSHTVIFEKRLVKVLIILKVIKHRLNVLYVSNRAIFGKN